MTKLIGFLGFGWLKDHQPSTMKQSDGNNYFTPHLAILFQNLINKYKFAAKDSEYV